MERVWFTTFSRCSTSLTTPLYVSLVRGAKNAEKFPLVAAKPPLAPVVVARAELLGAGLTPGSDIGVTSIVVLG